MSNLQAYPNIPRMILDVVKKNYPDADLEQLDRLLHNASVALDKSPIHCLKDSDRRKKALKDRTNLESYIAEMRSVLFLRGQGFSSIEQICPGQEPHPDFCANIGERKFAIEVRNIQKDSFFEPFNIPGINSRLESTPGVKSVFGPGLIKVDKLEDYMFEQMKDKKTQLDSGRIRFNCECSLAIMVIDAKSVQAFNDRDGFLLMLRELHDKLNWGQSHYLGLITGQSRDGLPDDCIYPDIEDGRKS